MLSFVACEIEPVNKLSPTESESSPQALANEPRPPTNGIGLAAESELETHPDSVSSNPRPHAGTEIVFLFNGLYPAHESVAEAEIANLKSLTGIVVKPDFSDWWEYWDRQPISMQRWPDIWQSRDMLIPHRAAKGWTLELDDYVANWGDWADFYPSARETASYAGNVYGIPYNARYRGSVVFRPSLFESAGLPAEPPGTWDELNEITPKLTKTDGEVFEQAGFNLSHHTEVFEDWLLQAGGRPFNPDLTEPTNNTPEGHTALAQHVRHGLIDETMPREGMDSGVPNLHAFCAGSVAIQMLWTANVSNCESRAPGVFEDLEVGRPLAGPRQRGMYHHINSYLVSSSTKAPEAVFEVLKYFSSPARNYEINVLGDFSMPFRRAMENFEIYRSEPWKSFQKNTQFTRVRQIVPEHIEVFQAMGRRVETAALGELSVSETLRLMDKEVLEILEG